MSANKVTKITRTRQRKYLIAWSLTLGHGDLEKISRQPVALDKALSYVRSLAKKNELEIYRFVAMEELTRHMRSVAEAKVSGIAITRAASVEEAGEMIKEWVAGLSYGETPIGNYLEYEIKPLAEIGLKGRG